MNKDLINSSRYRNTLDGLFNKAVEVIESARSRAYRQINESLVRRNWELGKMIAEEELNGEDRAKYGAQLIKELAKRLTRAYGKGFAFVARQQHIHTEKEDYFIDLVFYNYILKSFVLIDLKTSKIRHQDVGQMDMYVRIYDERMRSDSDNPTIGILLCDDTDEDIARYSVLHDNDRLFVSKYMLYLPTPEQLRA